MVLYTAPVTIGIFELFSGSLMTHNIGSKGRDIDFTSAENTKPPDGSTWLSCYLASQFLIISTI